MDSWSSWDGDDASKDKPVYAGIQDYIEDLAQQEMPATLLVYMDHSSLRYRARIVDADNHGHVLMDRLGERFMDTSGTDLHRILGELDCMAAAKPRGVIFR